MEWTSRTDAMKSPAWPSQNAPVARGALIGGEATDQSCRGGIIRSGVGYLATDPGHLGNRV